MARHLISLIDGTSVSAARVEAYQSYSNVFELAYLLQLNDRSDDGQPQIVFYTSGISSQPDSRSIVNLLTGNSIMSQIIDQYINICSNYDFASAERGCPDKIYLFGFSRGAMAVRALASIIAEFGLLEPANVRQLPLVLDAWMRSIGRGNLSNAVRTVNAEVEFVGLFDSVMGGSERLPIFNPVRFKNMKLPARCRIAVQVLAIDENRTFFKPQFWKGMTDLRRDREVEATRMLRQIWMPGVHSDVGGTASPNWGRAAFLAMTYFVQKYTNLGIDQGRIAEKERRFREGIEDGRFFISPHRGPFTNHQRRPIGEEAACESSHPVCWRTGQLTYGNKSEFAWLDRIFTPRFADMKSDPELDAYFGSILKAD